MEAIPVALTPGTREIPGLWFWQGCKEDPGTDFAGGCDVVRSRSTGRYYLGLPAGGLTAASIGALCLIAFATGSLVRYHPGYWISLVGRNGAGSWPRSSRPPSRWRRSSSPASCSRGCDDLRVRTANDPYFTCTVRSASLLLLA